ncbi:MAG: hypothetical protein BWY82_02389 [Verrucomicrobia bacterium ADurb.Bin474]|nr:MAG: hypothetical protein BWY82_02389 [Verrucomicrobia bacterium ADurb.Bin474]
MSALPMGLHGGKLGRLIVTGVDSMKIPHKRLERGKHSRQNQRHLESRFHVRPPIPSHPPVSQ